jgi:hypothetical protein
MKLNMESKLLSIKGLPLLMKDEKGETFELTLGSAALEAMLSDRGGDGASKYNQYKLAQKLAAGGEIDLLPEEVSEIKARIGMVFNPAVIGASYDILNG